MLVCAPQPDGWVFKDAAAGNQLVINDRAFHPLSVKVHQHIHLAQHLIVIAHNQTMFLAYHVFHMVESEQAHFKRCFLRHLLSFMRQYEIDHFIHLLNGLSEPFVED